MARENKRNRNENRFGRPERLADVILAEGTTLPRNLLPYVNPDDWNAQAELCRKALVRAPVIFAQNVYDYCMGFFNGKRIFYATDVPNFMPPFQSTFVEFRHKDSTHGWLFQSWTREEFASVISDPDPRCRYLVTVQHYFKPHLDPWVFGPAALRMIQVDEKGAALSNDMQIPVALRPSSSEEGDPSHVYNEVVRVLMFAASLAISFMHCKNVATRTIEPDALVNRERRKAGLKPFIRYQVLDINPMKAVLRSEGQSNTVGLKQALHICQGHFVTYSPERPMFGKLAGTFWVPEHPRGSIDQGIVVSDYEVHAPAPTHGSRR